VVEDARQRGKIGAQLLIAVARPVDLPPSGPEVATLVPLLEQVPLACEASMPPAQDRGIAVGEDRSTTEEVIAA